MPQRRLDRKEAAFTHTFLQSEGVGYGYTLPHTEYFDVEGSDQPGERTTYVITIPYGWLKGLLIGVDGAEEEPVVVTHWPDGTADIVGSKKALSYVAQEVRKGISQVAA